MDCADPQYAADCSPQLRVLTAISSRGTNWALSFTVPSTAVFSGPSNTIWGYNASSDFELTFQKLQSSLRISLTHVGYWGTQTVQEYNFCVAGAYCCLDVNNVQKSYQLVAATQYPTYRVFQISSAASTWDLSANLTIGNQSSSAYIIPMSNTATQGVWPPNVARPLLKSSVSPLWRDYASSILSMATGNYLAVDSTWSHSPFLVSLNQFSDGAYHIALTQPTFNALMYGACDITTATQLVQISSVTPDSFSNWFGSSLVSMFPDAWVSIPNSRFASTQSPPYYLSIIMNTQETYLLETTIDATQYQLLPLSSEPIGIGGGSFEQSATSFLVYLDVSNVGRTSGSVEVQSLKCCYLPLNGTVQILSCAILFFADDFVNGAVQTSTMTPGETQRFRFVTPIVPIGQSGYCTFAMRSGYTYVSYYDVGFSIPGTTALSASPSTPSGTCDPPNVPSPDPPYCQSPCTIDQVYNNATGLCDPVDCIVKYMGARNVYDATSGVCKPGGVSSSPSSPPTPTSSSVANGSAPVAPSSAPQFVYNVDCGPHGTFDAQSGTCDCAAGWITNMQQPSYSFIYCNVASNFAPNTIVGEQAPNNKLKVSYFALIIALPITLGVVIIGSIITAKILNGRCGKSGNAGNELDEEEDEEKEEEEPASDSSSS